MLLVGSACGQHIAAVVPSEPPADPVSKPEPRHRAATSPLTIFTNLVSKTTETQRFALRQLGVRSGLDSLSVDDVRLELSNLDTDNDFEAILIYTIGRRLTSAAVFDKFRDAWWQVGAFDYSWHWNSETAERLIGLREIVWPRRKDLVVRQESGGTGVVRTDLAVYRMYNGVLFRVFNINEGWHYAAVGQQDISAYSEKHDVTFGIRRQHTRPIRQPSPKLKRSIALRILGTLLSLCSYRMERPLRSFAAPIPNRRAEQDGRADSGDHAVRRMPEIRTFEYNLQVR
jgi:hypothetical protein